MMEYMEFDRRASRNLKPVEYLLQFGQAVSAATVKANEHNMKHGFELHITVNADNDTQLTMQKCMAAYNKTRNLGGWSFSRIDGDPVLGAGVKSYLTSYAESFDVALVKLSAMASSLRSEGVQIMREKIELIMHDVRYQS